MCYRLITNFSLAHILYISQYSLRYVGFSFLIRFLRAIYFCRLVKLLEYTVENTSKSHNYLFILYFRIDLKIRPGSLIAVVGNCGSGKSSLISALLGDMRRQAGYVQIKVVVLSGYD